MGVLGLLPSRLDKLFGDKSNDCDVSVGVGLTPPSTREEDVRVLSLADSESSRDLAEMSLLRESRLGVSWMSEQRMK